MDYLDYIPDEETYEIYNVADNGVTYDSQKVSITVGTSLEFADVSIPSYGTSQNTMISDWIYLEETPETPRVHPRMNLWLLSSGSPSDRLPQAVIIRGFHFRELAHDTPLPGAIMLLLNN